MSDNTGHAGPAIAPPLLIVICIVGAVVAVIVTAALYKLCRRVTADANEDVGDKSWNPNQRRQEQTQYMEEVRMRNKMFAWERSRMGRTRRYAQDRIEKQYSGKGVSEEEYLEEISLDDNPYEEVVDECMRRQSYHMPKQQSPRKFHRPFRHDVVQHGQGFVLPESAVPLDEDQEQNNNSGVRITVNDGGADITDVDGAYISKWPPRQSRMFRSSSIYSGDALLPSTHLHLVQSSSNYAFGKNGSSKE